MAAQRYGRISDLRNCVTLVTRSTDAGSAAASIAWPASIDPESTTDADQDGARRGLHSGHCGRGAVRRRAATLLSAAVDRHHSVRSCEFSRPGFLDDVVAAGIVPFQLLP